MSKQWNWALRDMRTGEITDCGYAPTRDVATADGLTIWETAKGGPCAYRLEVWQA